MLKEQIQNAITEAMKSGEELILSVLRMLLTAIISKEKEKRYKISKIKPDLKEEQLVKESQLSDEEIIDVISSEIKKRKDAITLYDQGKRPELAEKEKKEIVILQKYLPAQMSEEEIKKIVAEAVAKTGAKEVKDMGKVMAEIMPKTKGKADSSLVSKIVKESLTGK